MTAYLFSRRSLAAAVFGAAVFAAGAPGMAQEATVVRVTLKGNRFEPAEVRAPAGKPVTLVVKNLDPTPAEFESKMLRVEKIIAGGAEVTINITAKSPGRYRFFDDYHEATTQGFLVVE